MTMDFSFMSKNAAQRHARPEDETPFRLLVLADLSGRGSRGVVESIGGRKAVAVDVDNLDAVIAKLKPEIHIPVGESKMAIPIGSFDDFHPDQIARRIQVFAALKQVKLMLASPATFEIAAAQVRQLAGLPPKGAAAPAAAPAPVATEDGGRSAFDDLISRPADVAKPVGPAPFDVSKMVADMVREYVVPNPDPEQKELVKLVDDALGTQMRAILHHPAFASVEAAWRGVQFLTSRIETDETLKIYVLDVSKAELAADLAGGDPKRSGLHTLLVEQTVGSQGGLPWAAVGGDYEFGPTDEDVALLAKIATVAQAAGAPFVAGAGNALFGVESLGDTPDAQKWTPPDVGMWDVLRKMSVADSVALAWPRFLLRLPYGKNTEPTDLRFEEVQGKHRHEQYLWGNAMYPALYMLADAFRDNQWDMQPGGFADIDDLPVHSYTDDDGEKTTKATAEAYLSDRAAALVASRGVIPLISIKGRDAARFAGFHSIAEPSKALAGRWG